MNLKLKLDNFFKVCEDFIYLLIGALLIVTALFLVYGTIKNFFHYSAGAEFIIGILDNILLILMIIEIFYTIRVSIKEHSLCAEPFLIVALIAAVRRILVISVETAYMADKFNHHMIEISILGGLIFIFVVSTILLRRKK